MADRKSKPEWATFGDELRRMRERRGKTGAATAKAVGLSPTMYSSIERGKRFCLREHAVNLDEFLGAGNEVVRTWTRMSAPERLPDWFYRVPELERSASEIREFQPLLIPGLLQTRSYARSLFRASRPGARAVEVERMIEARVVRWELLEDDQCPLLWFVLGASVLTGPVGPDTCMAEQLGHLSALVEDGKIYLQILPTDAPAAPGRDGPFRLYRFPDRPTIVSAEYMTGEKIIDDTEPEKLRHCEIVFGALQAASRPTTDALDQIMKARTKFQ
ncbi:helix-turn-helix domain-containing protein [Nocardiopsis suaedae]|uniref:Helix-turn-helix transcriptional regulator n=1 Tax=Nocardiopsis suaedae TaxID=3018444 RepID=A0ABT4TGC2_9ACTN|nr:helix-turn-helix transcriptional regulator [Nocardiopsis suaedae]MDA2803681.1 helix-turn-helix transcriptional regulator [Nocardiopsis suaedae]